MTKTTHISDNPTAQQGFILPMVLWMIAALALIAAVIGQWSTQGVDAASSRRADFETELRFQEAKSTLLYQFSTQLLSPRGLEIAERAQIVAALADPFSKVTPSDIFVALDNRPYKMGKLEIRIQDARGLVNLNLAKDEEIFRLLGLFDVPVEARGGLVAKLRDYTQDGELPRLNGAKTRQYVDAGRPKPSLAPLVTPFEARRVMDWEQYPQLWKENGGLADVTTSGDSFGTNLNTAAPKVLASIEGLNPRAVELILETRRLRPILNTQDAQMAAGVALAEDPMRFISFPADSFRVRLHDPSRRLDRVFMMKITANQVSGPWRIDYELDLPQVSFDDRDPESTPDFPIAPPVPVVAR